MNVDPDQFPELQYGTVRKPSEETSSTSPYVVGRRRSVNLPGEGSERDRHEVSE